MFTKFKHSRLALLLWTLLAMSIGYGFATLQDVTITIGRLQ